MALDELLPAIMYVGSSIRLSYGGLFWVGVFAKWLRGLQPGKLAQAAAQARFLVLTESSRFACFFEDEALFFRSD